jgi:hypothetical protein
MSKKGKKEVTNSVYGPFIVHLHKTMAQKEFELELNNFQQLKKSTYYDSSFLGFKIVHRIKFVNYLVIEGMTEFELLNLPGVLNVAQNTIKRIRFAKMSFFFIV